jgi:hypothetical protein
VLIRPSRWTGIRVSALAQQTARVMLNIMSVTLINPFEVPPGREEGCRRLLGSLCRCAPATARLHLGVCTVLSCLEPDSHWSMSRSGSQLSTFRPPFPLPTFKLWPRRKPPTSPISPRCTTSCGRSIEKGQLSQFLPSRIAASSGHRTTLSSDRTTYAADKGNERPLDDGLAHRANL